MKKYLTKDNINNYKKYKYESEDRSYLSSKYKIFWDLVQKIIPKYVHPNIITLLGLLSVIFGYNMMKIYSNNFIMGLCIFLYMNFDAIDGIHARNTFTSSVIGEYLDHIIDLVNISMLTDCLLTQIDFTDSFVKNIFTTTASYCFIITHYESVILNKIKFEGVTDVSLILTIISIIFLTGLRLPTIMINNIILLGILSLIAIGNTYKFYQLVCKTLEKNINFELAVLIGIWYIIKYIGSIFNPTNYIWTITIIDTILLVELINFKIFRKNPNLILGILPGIFSINPLIISSIIINYLINCINKISTELKINIFQVEHKKLRVFCCGVFDMCHIGHLMLFKKIYDSFDVPIKLIVGVHNDKSCIEYKRETIINEKLRYKTVELCKYVDEVVEDCPLVITKEFIEQGEYDVVIIGEEYKNNKDIDWYPGAFELNNYKYISRFTEISTTDIINKIKSLKK